jgi:hypothetical protein
MADRLLAAVVFSALGAAIAGSMGADIAADEGMGLWRAAVIPIYAVLVMLSAALLRNEPNGILVSVLIVSLLGMAVEIGQPLLGRSATFMGYLSNEVGVGVGAVIVQWRRHALSSAREEGR